MELKYSDKFEPWKGSRAVLIRKDGNEDYLNKVILEAVTAERHHHGDVDTVSQQCHFNEWELEDGSHWVTIDGNFSGYLEWWYLIKLFGESFKLIFGRYTLLGVEVVDPLIEISIYLFLSYLRGMSL